MSSKDPLASIAEGATKGTLEYLDDKIKGYVTRLRNRDIAFVEDIQTIKSAKESKNASEYKFFKQYIESSDYRVQFLLGLTLKKFEKDNKRLTRLRTKIVLKYGEKGLHVAQFVQNGLISNYIGNVLETLTINPEDLPIEIEKLFDNIENIVNYVEQSDNVDKKVKEIAAKINAFSPKIYVICSSKLAMEQGQKVLKGVLKEIQNYEVELYKTDIKEVYFLKRTLPKPSGR
jgi:translation elongation factor EF-1beta